MIYLTLEFSYQQRKAGIDAAFAERCRSWLSRASPWSTIGSRGCWGGEKVLLELCRLFPKAKVLYAALE